MWVSIDELIEQPCAVCRKVNTGPRRHEGHASARFGDRGDVYLDGLEVPRCHEADMAAGWVITPGEPVRRCLAGDHAYMYQLFGKVLIRLKP